MKNLLLLTWYLIGLAWLLTLASCSDKSPAKYLIKLDGVIHRCNEVITRSQTLIVARCETALVVGKNYVIEEVKHE